MLTPDDIKNATASHDRRHGRYTSRLRPPANCHHEREDEKMAAAAPTTVPSNIYHHQPQYQAHSTEKHECRWKQDSGHMRRCL